MSTEARDAADRLEMWQRRALAAEAEVTRLQERIRAVETLLPPPMVAVDGMVEHDGGFSHSLALQCDLCDNFPHMTCVYAPDLRAALADGGE